MLGQLVQEWESWLACLFGIPLIWTIVAVTELSAILNSANYNNWKEVGYSTFPVHFINMPLADILDDMKTSDLNRILLQV